MAKDSKIEWTHHTFNPWWGCTKVSPGCKHCYAEAWARRTGRAIWGLKAERRQLSDAYWRQPLLWNKDAEQTRVRARVFCASMADVFEDRRDLDSLRARLWQLIEQTPFLDWLLLTKRPQNMLRLAPWSKRWPANVWAGTTTENQRWAEKRIPQLLRVPAGIHFLSAEPLLGPLDLTPWLSRGIDWVIAGGESGPHARPMNPEWARAIRDQCRVAGTSFLFKQWGNWAPESASGRATRELLARDGTRIVVTNLGKKGSGRRLDGETWDEVPSRTGPAAAFA
ncbi:MAG TPA: phage Gp37/Gp68 family protein [Steroidobacteraceae bacterium]|nr:phage Gp37/Gp68 family protein [Steroidobacteraceae bacterium]